MIRSTDLIEIIRQSISSIKDKLFTYGHDDINRFNLIKDLQLQELTLEFMQDIKK